MKTSFTSPGTSSVIMVGNVPLGGHHPIRVQSMTTTDTLDTRGSLAQCIRIIEAGADFVRLTAQGTREAENLASIKRELRKAGFETPLIADIHFNPSAAEVAAGIVEKIRINPGNYADKRASFKQFELTDRQYNEELERIHSRLLPLINICQRNDTAIRIGVNHGSLSDRIMTRYGNTAEGMVISALEFIRIMQSENFHKLVISLKSSDTNIMISANRLLVRMMKAEGMSYPVHLGVTEAGEGEDGRVRSAAGIGALLAGGIGDTIRVSLSEEPEKEIPVGKKIAAYFSRDISSENQENPVSNESFPSKPLFLNKINGPLVMAEFTGDEQVREYAFQEAGYTAHDMPGGISDTGNTADIIITSKVPETVPESFMLAAPLKEWAKSSIHAGCFPLLNAGEYGEIPKYAGILKIIEVKPDHGIEDLKGIDERTDILLFRFSPEQDRYSADRLLIALSGKNLHVNVILNPVFNEDDIEDLMLKASSLLGRYLTDRNISGICITNRGKINYVDLVSLSFSILQCTSARITRTIYLSCPGCGRTKFDLQSAVKEVKKVTGHLKGLKIAVMGCIVNGPGEMAGADYGYVGAGNGKVHIYKGTTPVIKNVPEKDATDELVRFIERDQASL